MRMQIRGWQIMKESITNDQFADSNEQLEYDDGQS